jgi:hypothetical protein
MFLCTFIQDLIKFDSGGGSGSFCSNHYTKLRLERARLRRKEPSSARPRCKYDNCLRDDVQISLSLQRIAHANLIGFCYWTQGKESLSQLFWAQQCSKLKSTFPKHGTGKGAHGDQDSRLDFTLMAVGIELEFLASLLPESQMNRLLGNYVIRNKGQEQDYRSSFIDEQIAGSFQKGFA